MSVARTIRWTAAVALALLAAVLAAGSTASPARAGGGCRGMASTEGAGTSVEMAELCFRPTVLHVTPGDTVTWTNRDQAEHMVSGATVEWGNYGTTATNASVSYRFDQPGTYPYYCFAHPGMIGAIVVGDGRGGAGTAVKFAAPPAPVQSPQAEPAPAAVAAVEESPGSARWPWAAGGTAAGMLAGIAGTVLVVRRR